VNRSLSPVCLLGLLDPDQEFGDTATRRIVHPRAASDDLRRRAGHPPDLRHLAHVHRVPVRERRLRPRGASLGPPLMAANSHDARDRQEEMSSRVRLLRRQQWAAKLGVVEADRQAGPEAGSVRDRGLEDLGW
jgi:hypothetical protein